MFVLLFLCGRETDQTLEGVLHKQNFYLVHNLPF